MKTVMKGKRTMATSAQHIHIYIQRREVVPQKVFAEKLQKRRGRGERRKATKIKRASAVITKTADASRSGPLL